MLGLPQASHTLLTFDVFIFLFWVTIGGCCEDNASNICFREVLSAFPERLD